MDMSDQETVKATVCKNKALKRKAEESILEDTLEVTTNDPTSEDTSCSKGRSSSSSSLGFDLSNHLSPFDSSISSDTEASEKY